ncbi:MAG: phasin family protein [Thermoanaerobaculales bacterium]
MMAKKKAKELQNDIMDSAHKVWLAGLGAMSVAEEKGGEFVQGLIDKGQKLETRSKQEMEKAKGTMAGVKTIAESYWETFGRTLDDKLTLVIHRIGVPTKEEIETLTKKVEDLTVSIDKLRVKGTAKPAARTAKPKAASTAKKPAAKKTTTTTNK